jgi:hypothetical protein
VVGPSAAINNIVPLPLRNCGRRRAYRRGHRAASFCFPTKKKILYFYHSCRRHGRRRDRRRGRRLVSILLTILFYIHTANYVAAANEKVAAAFCRTLS